MAKGRKTGGRVAGTPNKSRVDAVMLAQELDIDPLRILLLFAKGDYASLGYEKTKTIITKDGSAFEELTISPDLRKSAAADACKYIYAPRKAIEISVEQETIESYEEIIQRLSNQDKE